jgi:stage II sporulation protein E
VARFVKLGAAASFIRRGSDVEIIRSTSLPLGVLERADYDSVVKKLQDGDEIILVSDGVVEALDGDDKEGQLRQMILDIKEKAPKAVAARLMEMVCTCNNRPLADDMSILVAGVFDTAINVY